jgi:hypothetical protein
MARNKISVSAGHLAFSLKPVFLPKNRHYKR